jgi:integrase
LLENGIALSLIQKLLGHNDIRTTLRYTPVADKQAKGIENPLDAIMRKNSHASNSAIKIAQKKSLIIH